jgi:hypothetical protein
LDDWGLSRQKMKQNFQLHYFYGETENAPDAGMVYINCAVVTDGIAAESEGEKGLFNGSNYGKDTPGEHVGRE